MWELIFLGAVTYLHHMYQNFTCSVYPRVNLAALGRTKHWSVVQRKQCRVTDLNRGNIGYWVFDKLLLSWQLLVLDTVSFYLDGFPGYSRGTFLDQLCFGGFGRGCHCSEAAALSVCDCSAVALFLDPEGFTHSRAGKVPKTMSRTGRVVCGFFCGCLLCLMLPVLHLSILILCI